MVRSPTTKRGSAQIEVMMAFAGAMLVVLIVIYFGWWLSMVTLP